MKKNASSKKIKIGLVVNPYAGLGGEAALKGTDGVDVRQQALDYHHQTLRSPKRVERFLNALVQLPCQTSETAERATIADIEWYCLPNDLGESALKEQGIIPKVLSYQAFNTSQDTLQAVQYFMQSKVDLIVFAGGDGTARDVLDALGDENTNALSIGIPAGVKMQSAVFAITPEMAAQILHQWLQGELNTVALQDVRDIDESALRDNKIRSKYYGAMHTLASPQFLQRLKQSGIEQDDLVLDDIADHLDELLDEGFTLLIGPGSTTAHFMQRQGLKNTLVGFDALNKDGLIGTDLTGQQCQKLLESHAHFKLVITPTGQQGFLIGRGNQQLTEHFLSYIKKEQICIISTKNKLNEISDRQLHIDTNNLELDEKLSGFYPIVTAYQETVIYPVGKLMRPI